MRFSLSSALALSLISTSVNAFVIRDAPAEATAVRHEHAVFDQIPRPTAAPAEVELRRRQAANQRTLLGAGDNTCGFLNGDTCQFPLRSSRKFEE